MSLTTSEMTPADIRACTCNDGNNGGMFGNDWAWIIILLLFGYGGRGFGFGGGGGYGAPPATQADLAAGFNNSAVLSGINGIDSALCQGFNGINTAILAGNNALAAQLAQCCCDNRAAIADVKYTIANEACETRHALAGNARDIIDNANANSRAILDFLTNDKIATLTAENQSLKFAASQAAQNAFITANQEAQTAELIRRLGRDCPVPAYVVPNPNCCYTPNNGCGGF
jgi:hypothetical protein